MDHLTNARYSRPIFPLQRKTQSSQDARFGQFRSNGCGNLEYLRSLSYSSTNNMQHQNNFNARAYSTCGYTNVVPPSSFPFISSESSLSLPHHDPYSSLSYSTSAASNTSDFTDERGAKTGGCFSVYG